MYAKDYMSHMKYTHKDYTLFPQGDILRVRKLENTLNGKPEPHA